MMDAGTARTVLRWPPEPDSPSARAPQNAEAVPAEPARRSRPAVGSIGQKIRKKIGKKTRTEPPQKIPLELRAKTTRLNLGAATPFARACPISCSGT